MMLSKLTNQFVSLSIRNALHTSTHQRSKSVVDPALASMKEKRKLKKIERAIRQASKIGRHLKPIMEIGVDYYKLETLAQTRTREPESITEEDEAILAQWSKYKMDAQHTQFELFFRRMKAQKTALARLKSIDAALFEEAAKFDQGLDDPRYLYASPGAMVTSLHYVPVDGKYSDMTKTYITKGFGRDVVALYGDRPTRRRKKKKADDDDDD